MTLNVSVDRKKDILKRYSMGVKILLGKKIKRLRKMRGYTQEKFAEIIDITPRNLNRIESGENFVSSDTLDKILSALNVTAETLFSFEHLKNEAKKIEEMYNFIDKIKFKPTQLEKAYRILRIIADDEF
jgi:transcriptional regulator with XRE-family HTH domain